MEIVWKKMCVNVAWFIVCMLFGMSLFIIILVLLMIILDKWERTKRMEAEATRRTPPREKLSKPNTQGNRTKENPINTM